LVGVLTTCLGLLQYLSVIQQNVSSNVKNGKKTRQARWKVSMLDAKVLEVLGNQNSHNQTLMDIKTMFSNS
jgi:hypothetical protein